MPADDYEVTQDDASRWSSAVQEEEAQQAFQNSGNSDNANEYEQNAGSAGDEYAAGVAEYANIDPSDVQVDDEYESGSSSAGSEWQSGVQGAGERWADGVAGAEDEYLEGAEGAAQDWFNNYVEGVQDN